MSLLLTYFWNTYVSMCVFACALLCACVCVGVLSVSSAKLFLPVLKYKGPCVLR